MCCRSFYKICHLLSLLTLCFCATAQGVSVHPSQVYLTISQLSIGYLLPIVLQTLWVLLLISRLSLHYSASVLANYGESVSKTRLWSTNMLPDVYDIGTTNGASSLSSWERNVCFLEYSKFAGNSFCVVVERWHLHA